MSASRDSNIEGNPNGSLNLRIKASKEQVERGEVVEADDDFFQRKRDMIFNQYFDKSTKHPQYLS